MQNKIINKCNIDFYINEEDYASAASILFERQLKNWNLLRKRYDALNDVIIKEIRFEGCLAGHRRCS